MPFTKKYIPVSLALFFAVAFLLPISPLAAQTTPPPAGRSSAGQDVLKFLGATAEKGGLTSNPNQDTDITGIVIVVINTLLALTGIIFFVHVFYAGYVWMTSRGNEQQVTEAKETIRTSIIGILIVLSAFMITNFVFNQLGKISGGNLTPQQQT